MMHKGNPNRVRFLEIVVKEMMKNPTEEWGVKEGYIIKWKSTVSKHTGRWPGGTLTKEQADLKVEELNRLYLFIHHYKLEVV